MASQADLVEKHRATIEQAIEAWRSRTFFAHWAEVPSGKVYGESAAADGKARFDAQLGKPFDRLLHDQAQSWHGEEESPYGFALGISYPVHSPDVLVANAQRAQRAWSALTPWERAAVLVEALQQSAAIFFELAHATQHTTGQGFVMAFQASGPHAFDRALEAIAAGVWTQEAFATSADWVKPLGKATVRLSKRYRIRPRGVNVTIGCSTFPVWNSVPGMFASLVTGAATIAKAHPKVVYPIALVVGALQQALDRLGFNPHLVQLAVPTPYEPMTQALVGTDGVGTVDYTGSAAFGDQLERFCAEHGIVCFTEKSGVNPVLVESVESLDAALENLAFSICLYSSQMCTAPQNIFVPAAGVAERSSGRTVPLEEFIARCVSAIDALVQNEKVGPGTLGAIQSPATLDRIERARTLGVPILRDSAPIVQPEYPNARTATPLVLRGDTRLRAQYEHEWFGPIAFVVPVASFEHGLEEMTSSVRRCGVLSTLVYTTDGSLQSAAEEALLAAGAPVAFNFSGPVWINQSAAFSDFHGTAATRAGNASFTDVAFVASRYSVVGTRCGE
ncbi:MAG: aldehyde dehydrogenase family protein [Chlorobi bacterium]|nr:aldehyde dehydrogenase family protein [Chlorobiota bacterium]